MPLEILILCWYFALCPYHCDIMPFASLVYDVAVDCVIEAIGSSEYDYIAFVRRRAAILHVSKPWRDLAHSAASLWTHIVLTPRLPISTLRLWMGRTSCTLAPLALEVAFVDVDLYYNKGNPSARLLAYARRALPIIFSAPGRIQSLILRIDDAACSAYVMELVALLPVTIINRVRFECCCPLLGMSVGGIGLTAYLALPLFLNGGPTLTHLSLRSVGIQWDSFVPIASLQCLELRDVAFHGLPSPPKFWQVLRGTRQLLRLSLIGSPVVFIEPCIESRSSTTLAALDFLELDFKGSADMARLVAQLQLPALRKMVLHLGDYNLDALQACVLANPSIFYSASEVVLAGRMCGPVAAFVPGHLFSAFDSIDRLDLQAVDPFIFHATVRCMEMGTFTRSTDVDLLCKLAYLTKPLSAYVDVPGSSLGVDSRQESRMPITSLTYAEDGYEQL
ncbi:hypothetical protein C8J57DRAFT_1546624 [Mycena rebaudengoi]|nr:hypothetical protein C8J57DRAFT_1546624 [Mycena rebaudengoi]